MGALLAALKLSSPDRKLNRVMQEAALDVATGRYEITILEHTPGVANKVPDACSRRHQPGVEWAVPAQLASIKETIPGARGPTYWESLGL